MDSLTQMALGAAVGTAVLGRRAGPRAALWGAAIATLPDLDVLISYGDPVKDFTFHRAESHAIFWMTAVSPALAALAWRLHRRPNEARGVRFRDWWLLVWLALVTHALLDAFTVYGTQLLLPFSDYPVGVGSIFIIDPLYTLPLLAGVVGFLLLRHRSPDRAARWNTVGLVASSAYLAWSLAAQWHVTGEVNRYLASTGQTDGRLLVTPTAFNTLLWRVVIMDDGAYHEGFRSLFDDSPDLALQRHENATHLLHDVRREWHVERLAWFSKGFYGVREAEPSLQIARESPRSARPLPGLVETAEASATPPPPLAGATPVVLSDLRMGQTPWFVFSFIVAERDGERIESVAPVQVPTQRPPASALPWLWRRIWDEDARYSSQTRDT
jgi:inner membrane protein